MVLAQVTPDGIGEPRWRSEAAFTASGEHGGHRLRVGWVRSVERDRPELFGDGLDNPSEPSRGQRRDPAGRW